MKKILCMLFVTFPLLGICQSYVFCPQIKTEAKQSLNNVSISIVFKDNRTYEKKVKEKCTKTEIFSEFVNCLKLTFPNINVMILSENKFDENPTKGILSIKIELQKYDATFYSGMYISSTKFEVKIFDAKNGEKIVEEIISGDGKQFNALGLKGAKVASNNSFKEAFDKFALILEKL